MRLRTLIGATRGTAAAEMALMLPLLVMLLMGTFEGGYFLWSEHKVVKGVRDGARYAARQDFSKYTCPSTIEPAADASGYTLEDYIKNVTRTGTRTATDRPSVPGWTNDEVTVTLSCDDTTHTGIYAELGTAPRVKVSASVPYPSLFGPLGFNTASIHLNASAESAVMGL